MAASIVCKSCGAPNDPIFTNCAFCKTALPQMDMSSISNDDLVMNAAEWVGKTSEGFIVIHGPNSNEWTGKDIRRFQHGEIVGVAEKYLSLLAVRATTSPTLAVVYQDLKSKLDTNTKSGQRKSPQRMLLYVAAGFVVLMILVGVFGHFEASGQEAEKVQSLQRRRR